MEMILTGDLIGAEEAYRVGLVNRIVPARDVGTTAVELARTMASNGPVAVRFAKEAIHKGLDRRLSKAPPGN
jgi:enoyl-CoA hydratase